MEFHQAAWNEPLIIERSRAGKVAHVPALPTQHEMAVAGEDPFGSCTMKYNPKICDVVVQNHKLEKVHPEQDESTVQGILGILYKLERILCEVTGMSRMSLQPAAGAHGEFLGALIIRAYHRARGEANQRSEMLVPDSAHGTNPASAAMAGFRVVVVPSNTDGMVDLAALKGAVG